MFSPDHGEVPPRDLVHDLPLGPGHPAQLHHPALEIQDLLEDLSPSSVKQALLDLVHLLVEPVHEIEVVLHHAIHDGVVDEVRSPAEEIGVLLHPLQDVANGEEASVADGHQVAGETKASSSSMSRGSAPSFMFSP